MAQDKEERPNAALRKAGDTGDDSLRRTPGAQGRSTTREPGNGGDNAVLGALPGRRREHYIIGIRAAAGGLVNQHSMTKWSST